MAFESWNIPESIAKDVIDSQKRITVFDEEKRYLPLSVKKIWLREKYPMSSIRYIVHFSNEERTTVEARVYTDCKLPDEAFIGSGIITVFKSDIEPGQMMTDEARIASMLPIARGRAATRALADAGFGIQFYDKFEEPDPDGEDILKEKKMEEANEFAPTTLPPEETPSPSDNILHSEQQTLDFTEKEDAKDFQHEAVTDLSLEAARCVKADCGKAKERGLTLGECETNHPSNLIWMYCQPDCNTKSAIKVIAQNNPVLKKAFEEYKIAI